MRLILDAFKARRWSDEAGAALGIAAQMAEVGGPITPQMIATVPRRFYDANEAGPDDVFRELARALHGLDVASSRPELIAIDDIDSFCRAAEVPASTVVAISRPLELPEREVKRLVAEIIGEPYAGADWGGEADDLSSDRVLLGSKRVPTSFIFKGPAKPGTLTLATLGRNGDQLDRMLEQPADLFVVQHCNAVSAAVRRHLRRGIIALRATGNKRAVGSVWDGSDCARLFAAHGMIDRLTGSLRQ